MEAIIYRSGLICLNHGAKWTPGFEVSREPRGVTGKREQRDCCRARRGGERQCRSRGGGADRFRRVTLSWLIGQRIARQDLDRLEVTDDNAPTTGAGESRVN